MKRFLLLLTVIVLTACSVFDAPLKSGAEAGNVHYQCDSNRMITVRYISNGVILEYENVKHHLQYIRSSSGARYVGKTLIWWNKGAQNMLYHREDETLIENCYQAH